MRLWFPSQADSSGTGDGQDATHGPQGGEKVTEVCRRLGVSEQTSYRSKEQFAGVGVREVRELRSLRHENGKPKQLVADLTPDPHILQEIVAQKL